MQCCLTLRKALPRHDATKSRSSLALSPLLLRARPPRLSPAVACCGGGGSAGAEGGGSGDGSDIPGWRQFLAFSLVDFFAAAAAVGDTATVGKGKGEREGGAERERGGEGGEERRGCRPMSPSAVEKGGHGGGRGRGGQACRQACDIAESSAEWEGPLLLLSFLIVKCCFAHPTSKAEVSANQGRGEGKAGNSKGP